MSRRSTIREAFNKANGNLMGAAEILGVTVKQLRKWLSQDFDLTRELRKTGALEKRDTRQRYVPKTGVATKNGFFDNTPLASRRLTLREMRDAGIWVPLKDDKENRSDP